jgi:hypothetical protein
MQRGRKDDKVSDSYHSWNERWNGSFRACSIPAEKYQ